MVVGPACAWRMFLVTLLLYAGETFCAYDQAAFPDDLPSLRWRETGSVVKCCRVNEILVRSEDKEPTCQPANETEQWNPILLNGRSRTHQLPGDRTDIVYRNLTCDGNYFWLVDAGEGPGSGFELLTTGDLYLIGSDAVFPAGGFCADRLWTPGRQGRLPVTAARVCSISLHQASSLLDPSRLTPTCRRHTCLRKCCPRGLQIRADDQACVLQQPLGPDGHLWKPAFYTEGDQPAEHPPEYVVVSGNPDCGPSEVGAHGKVFALEPSNYPEDEFYLQTDGRLWVPSQKTTMELSQFCVDEIQYEDKRGDTLTQRYAIVCFGKPQESAYISNYIYSSLLVISTFFLFVTFVIYVSIPELQNLHGKCLLSHVSALFTAYICILVGQAHAVYANMAFCQATALFMYFSFLAACFWLNVMSFDIWLTFSRIRATAGNRGRKKTRRFIKYSIYCWLCPLALTLVTIVMQFAPDNLVPPEDVLRPGLGTVRCWFPGSWEMLAYFHAPILILMTANLVFFVLTAKNILQSENDARLVSKARKGHERFKIYVNLFIVMGITWIAEALSIHMGPKHIWFLTDVINSLQGFFIFLLFTLRQRTRKIIRRHLDSCGFFHCCRCCRSQVGDLCPCCASSEESP